MARGIFSLVILAVVLTLFLNSFAETYLTSSPPYANISIDGKAIEQTTPLKINNIKDGIHTVKLQYGNRIYEEKLLFSKTTKTSAHINIKKSTKGIYNEFADSLNKRPSFSVRLIKYKKKLLAYSKPFSNSNSLHKSLPIFKDFKKETFYPTFIGLITSATLFSLSGFNSYKSNSEFNKYTNSSTTVFTKELRDNSIEYSNKSEKFFELGNSALLVSSIFAGIAIVDWKF